MKFEESRRGKSFDDLVEDQKGEADRLGSAFDEARADHDSATETLDQLFSDAKEAAKDDKDKQPPHPFRQD